MTKKKLILIGGIVVLCLLICLCVAMCSPAEQSDITEPTGTTGTSTMTYTIQVRAESGTPLEQIGVYIYEDSGMDELVWFAKTDKEGKLTFTDISSDNYVAVLADVPAGYLAEEYYPLTGETTEIVLAAGLMEGDLDNVTYKLGDIMLDFSVTAPDGTVYTLSELLQEKKAVVLNFWYLQCDPCKSEFPYLQEAYEKYSDDVIVLAMNPVNTDDAEIAQFQQENGYTFVMAQCDPAWEKAMQLIAYPTTVVIDHYGNICLIHKGSITEAETFETIFEYYSAEDYEQTIADSIEKLEEAAGVEQTVGTKENPVEIGATQSFQVTVEPGQLMYYNIYRMTTNLFMTIRNETAYVIYNGRTYYPSGGTVSLSVSADDTNSACSVVFGNSGTETQTYTVYLSSAKGTYGNPYSLTLGQFTANVAAGNETGVYYTYVPTVDGLFTVEVESVTSGVPYKIVLDSVSQNGVASVQRTTESDGKINEDTGNRTVSINAYAGKKIQVIVGTLPDSSNSYPAATFKLNAYLTEGASEGSAQEEKITYSINVTDENRNPISGVFLNMTVNGETVKLSTNSDGVATSKQVAGSYPVILTLPTGYTANTTEFMLTEAYPSISIKLDSIYVEMETYTVKVLDEEGNPVSGAYVTIGTGYGETDAGGSVSITVAKDSYTAFISANGYLSGEVEVTPDSKNATVTLVAGEESDLIAYTVKAVDYYGNEIPGLKLSFKQNGAVKTSATTDSKGAVTTKLASGNYTVSVPASYYTDESKAVLSENKTSVTITVIDRVNGDTGSLYGAETYFVYEGATYLDGMQSNVDNYFLFQPEVSGVYRITTTDPSAEVSYWGNTFFLNEQPEIVVNNAFELNIKPSNIGGTHVIGITGSSDCILIVEWISEAILNESDLELVAYEASSVPVATTVSIPSGKTLAYVDVLNGKAEDYVLTKDGNGVYYLNGKQVYVHLGLGAPYLVLSDFIGVTNTYAANPFYQFVYDDNGIPIYKEDYVGLLTQYCKCMDQKTGLYPLTDDLMYIIKNGGDNKGWWDASNPNYIFLDTNQNQLDVNEEIAYMYNFCWFE